MKNSILLFTFLLTGFFSLSAQETETRDLSSFERISVATGIDATIVAGNENSIDISAKGIDLDRISTEIKNGKLVVKITKKWNNWSMRKNNVKATITYTEELKGVSASSGASVVSNRTIESRDIDLSASSGASLDVAVNSDNVDVNVSSGAEVSASGRTQDLQVDASSGAEFKGYELSAENADINGSSGASTKISVSNMLDANVSSGASVKYKGSPSSRDIDKSSGGSVKQVAKSNT